MQEYQIIKELGLPIVTPTRDLALPISVIDYIYNQTMLPSCEGSDYCWSPFYCKYPYQTEGPRTFENMQMVGIKHLEDAQP
jgi:hypothetical protein